MDKNYEIYYIYDSPVEYKKLKIYPVSVLNALEFYFYVDCLLLDKNSVPDAKIISMSYLDYLFYKNENDNIYLQKLDGLLKLVLKSEDIRYGIFNKKHVIQIDGEIYDSIDFDEIKSIICDQNSVETIDENIRKETRDELDKAKRIKDKSIGATKMCGFEDQLICISISTGMTLDEIKLMTLRKFKKYLARIDHKLHYEIYKLAQSSGFVEYKDKNFPKHWMADLENEDRYSDVLIDEDEVKNKIETG